MHGRDRPDWRYRRAGRRHGAPATPARTQEAPVRCFGPVGRRFRCIWGHPLEGSCHPLEGSCQEVTRPHAQLFVAFFLRIRAVCRAWVVPTTTRPCFRWLWCRLRSRSAPVTHQDQGFGRGCRRPDSLPAPGHTWPQKTVGTTPRPQRVIRSTGSRLGPTPGWLAA
jgi:hypothetical protein